MLKRVDIAQSIDGQNSVMLFKTRICFVREMEQRESMKKLKRHLMAVHFIRTTVEAIWKYVQRNFSFSNSDFFLWADHQRSITSFRIRFTNKFMLTSSQATGQLYNFFALISIFLFTEIWLFRFKTEQHWQPILHFVTHTELALCSLRTTIAKCHAVCILLYALTSTHGCFVDLYLLVVRLLLLLLPPLLAGWLAGWLTSSENVHANYCVLSRV